MMFSHISQENVFSTPQMENSVILRSSAHVLAMKHATLKQS
jgi:hypothetical protein